MTVAREGRGKAAAALAAASVAAADAGGAVTERPWDDCPSFRDSAGGGVAEPVSEGLVRTDGGDMRSPSSSAAAASVAFSSRLSRRSAEARGDGGSRRSSGPRSNDGKSSRGSTDFTVSGRATSQLLVADSNWRDRARDDPSDSYVSDHGSSSDQSSDSSGGSSVDSASVHEVDLPDVAEPASVFPQLMGAGSPARTQGPSGAATTTRPLVAPLCDDQTNAQWLSDGGGGQPLCAMLSVVLSPASVSASQEPLALRDMVMAGRGRHPSDAPTAQPTPPTRGSSLAIDPAAVAPTAGDAVGSHRRKSHRSRHTSASSSGAQPPPSPVNFSSPRERSRTAWDASPVSPHRSATPLSPHHRGRRSGASAALSRRGASVDLLPPSVVVSLDMRASSYAEETEGADHEDGGVFLSSQASSPLAAAIHASQLVGAGNRFSIASKMRRSPKAVPAAASRGSGAVGEDMGVSRSLSTTSNQSGGGGGGAETSSGGLQQRLMGGTRWSGVGTDGGGERPSTSFGGTFRRAPKHSTLGRLSSPDAPSSASGIGVGSSAAKSTTGMGVVPLGLTPGTAGYAGGAPSTGTGKALAAGSKPFFRRFSNARPSASGTSARTRGDMSAGVGGLGAAAGRPSADGSSLSWTATFGATDRGTPVATGGAACVSPSPFSPSEEACPSSNGTTTSTLVSAGARSRRKIAKVFFSRIAAAGTPSSSPFLNGSSASVSTPFTGAHGGPGGAGGAEEDESCTAFTAAVPPSTALAAVSRVLLSAGCDMSVKRDRTVKVKVDAPLGCGLHLHVNVLLEGVAVAGDPPGAQLSPTTHGEGTSAETGSGEAQVISATLVRLVRSRDDRGRTPQSEFVAFFHDFHAAFVQATLSRVGP